LKGRIAVFLSIVVATMFAVLALALPQHGVVVPGKSFGGLRLGATPAKVQAAWGARYGRCRGCSQPTWYFTYKKFAPQGAGVSFRKGVAASFFTIWSPPGWRTDKGLTVGDPTTRITQLYGVLHLTECGAYEALVIRRGRVDTQIYVYKEKVWGFGLSPAGAPPCH
jgi:hypothetical protein